LFFVPRAFNECSTVTQDDTDIISSYLWMLRLLWAQRTAYGTGRGAP